MEKFDFVSTSDESFTRSVVSFPTYTFNWSVENFSKLSENKRIRCHKFFVTKNHEFYAELVKSPHHSTKITFYLISESSIKINHTYSISDYSGKTLQQNSVIHNYLTKYSDHEIELAYTSEVEKFLSDSKRDTLIIKCVMEWEKVYTERLPCKFRPESVSSTDNLPGLSKDLKALYKTSLYADMILKVGVSTVRAHKLILCARSPGFARKLEQIMDKREEYIMHISDLDPPVLEDLVFYLYTDMLAKDDFESVYALYSAADKYEVLGLRKVCSDVLLSKLNVANVCSVLTLADRHSDVEFKESLLHFINFYSDKILEMSAFNDLATPLKTEVKALLCK